jgi:hypothetical protein
MMTPTDNPIAESFATEFQRLKRSADRGLKQLDEADFHFKLSERQNSIAAIIQHVHGNLISRFTDFLTTDGEKPDRDRESEFVEKKLSRDELLKLWEEAWTLLFAALSELSDGDLNRHITIRGEPYIVSGALARSIGHVGWHIAQILLIAKHVRGKRWEYVTIPPVKQ